jgi:hypothetical protein
MEITFELQKDDLREGYALYLKEPYVLNRGLAYFLIVVLFVCGAGMILITENWFWGLLPVGAAAVYIIRFAMLPNQLASRLYSRLSKANSPVTLAITEEGISSHTPTADTRRKWADYNGWRESQNVFAVMHSGTQFSSIPKRAFTPEQLAEFRELLARKIPQKK